MFRTCSRACRRNTKQLVHNVSLRAAVAEFLFDDAVHQSGRVPQNARPRVVRIPDGLHENSGGFQDATAHRVVSGDADDFLQRQQETTGAENARSGS